MLMAESHISEPARHSQAGIHGNTILMIADQDLLSECLAVILSNKFPAHEVVVRPSLAEVTEEELNDIKLVLLYRLPVEEIQAVVQRFHRGKNRAAMAMVVEGTEKLEGYFRRLAETRIIDGILPLNLRLDVFLAATDLLAKGGEHFPSALLQRLSNDPAADESESLGSELVSVARTSNLALPSGDMAALTTREVQILDLLCEGTQNKIIADKLHLSENTVKVHIRNIYKKMHVRNRTEAASRFFNNDRAMQAGKRRN